ncbi:hypothetical protein ACGK9R_12090 [Halomonas sp. HNIBRBA4712]|uniref:hypothetical protein n=1 Tax=Halomonas sp. HNIBRBA4712 TaxID=3373087 RepID=UPI003744D52D
MKIVLSVFEHVRCRHNALEVNDVEHAEIGIGDDKRTLIDNLENRFGWLWHYGSHHDAIAAHEYLKKIACEPSKLEYIVPQLFFSRIASQPGNEAKGSLDSRVFDKKRCYPTL